MESPRPLIVGNWKMHTTLREAQKLSESIVHGAKQFRSQVVLCPPLPWLVSVAEETKGTGVKIGVQDAAPGEFDAQTGNVSLGMIAPYTDYVILGHSERRLAGLDTDKTINAKVLDALKRGLTPIICVGEFIHLYENKRPRGRPRRIEAASNVVVQLRRALADVKRVDLKKIVIAYEPVWAIGGTEAATPEYAAKIIVRLRRTIARLGSKATAAVVPILYGGSVNPENAAALLSQKQIDGLLVGRASLKSDQFTAIVAACEEVR